MNTVTFDFVNDMVYMNIRFQKGSEYMDTEKAKRENLLECLSFINPSINDFIGEAGIITIDFEKKIIALNKEFKHNRHYMYNEKNIVPVMERKFTGIKENEDKIWQSMDFGTFTLTDDEIWEFLGKVVEE